VTKTVFNNKTCRWGFCSSRLLRNECW